MKSQFIAIVAAVLVVGCGESQQSATDGDKETADGSKFTDNGSEFIERGLREWLAENEIKTLYIEAGCPWQNGHIESFNARLREECLNREELWTLTEARMVIEDWRWKYNHVRPHRSLGYITPNKFAQDEVGEEAQGQCRTFGRATPPLRPSIDLLYNIEQIMPRPG